MKPGVGNSAAISRNSKEATVAVVDEQEGKQDMQSEKQQFSSSNAPSSWSLLILVRALDSTLREMGSQQKWRLGKLT